MIIKMPSRTYAAKLFEVPWESRVFKLAGTLDGFIDLAVPGGNTCILSLPEARNLAEAINKSIADVEANCLYEADVLLDREEK